MCGMLLEFWPLLLWMDSGEGCVLGAVANNATGLPGETNVGHAPRGVERGQSARDTNTCKQGKGQSPITDEVSVNKSARRP